MLLPCNHHGHTWFYHWGQVRYKTLVAGALHTCRVEHCTESRLACSTSLHVTCQRQVYVAPAYQLIAAS
jgi:hypothetical protein